MNKGLIEPAKFVVKLIFKLFELNLFAKNKVWQKIVSLHF